MEPRGPGERASGDCTIRPRQAKCAGKHAHRTIVGDPKASLPTPTALAPCGRETGAEVPPPGASPEACYLGAVLRRLLLLLVTVALLGTAACASTVSARSKLDRAARDVFDALQFGDFQVVAAYLAPELRTAFLARAFGVEKTLEVVEFTPVGLDFDEDGQHGRMVTRLTWFELPSTVVKTENIFLDWKRAGEGWQIERIVGGPLPVPDPSVGADVEADLRPSP